MAKRGPMLDHLLIGAIRQELRAAGWVNRYRGCGGPIFTIAGGARRAGDARTADVVWALEYLDGLSGRG